MSDESDKSVRKLKRIFSATAWLIVSLLAYVLSSGPMIWLCRHEYLSFEFCTRATEPLSWVYDRSAISHRFLDWYSAFWTSP
jgi:hypothetical protein